MTKIRNTKKGMAKKTLSISLAVAMLATSNVPVWAAEDLFTDGEVAVEAFTADEEVEAPVVEEEEAVAASTKVVESNDLSINVTVTEGTFAKDPVRVSGSIEAKDGTELTGLEYGWYDADNTGIAIKTGTVNLNNLNSMGFSPDFKLSNTQVDWSKYVNKKLQLYIFHDTTEADDIRIEKTLIGETTINKLDMTAAELKLAQNSIKYNGKDFFFSNDSTTDANAVTFASTALENAPDAEPGEDTWDAATVLKYFDVSASGTARNYGETLTVTATAKKDSPYKGTAKDVTLKVDRRDYVSGDFVLTVADGQSYQYTGKHIIIPEGKVTLKESDGLAGVDLTKAIKVAETTTSAIGKRSVTVTLDLDSSILDNFTNIRSVLTDGKMQSEPAVEITKRDLKNNCDVSVKNKKVPYGTALEDLAAECFTFTGDGVVLDLKNQYEENGSGIDYNLKVVNKRTGNEVKEALNNTDKYTVTITAYEDPSTGEGTCVNGQSFDIEVAKDVLTSVVPIGGEYKSVFSGTEIKPGKDTLGSLVLDGSSDEETVSVDNYKITGYKNNTNAATYKNGNQKTWAYATVEILAGAYKGEIFDMPFTILPLEVSADTVKVPATVSYNKGYGVAGDYKVPLVVTAKNGTVTKGLSDADYSVAYDYVNGDGSETASATNELHDYIKATITIKNPNFMGTNGTHVEIEMSSDKYTEIVAKALTDSMIKINPSSYTYTGGNITPDFTVMDGVYPLFAGKEGDTANSDYEIVSIVNNLNVGSDATIKIKGINDNYSGTASATFQITAADTSDVKVEVTKQQYTGKTIRPKYTAENYSVTLNGNDVKGQFEIVDFGENIKAGKGTVTLKPVDGNKNFKGKNITAEFEIYNEVVEGSIDLYDKNGKKVTNLYAVKEDGTTDLHTVFSFEFDGTEKTFGAEDLTILTSGTKATKEDFEIKYAENVAGVPSNYTVDGLNFNMAYVYAVAKEGTGYTGEDSITLADGTKIKNVVAKRAFLIKDVHFVESNVLVKNATYAGGLPVKPEVLVQIKGMTLVEGRDYVLSLSGAAVGENYTDVTDGKVYEVVVTGKGGYEGSEVKGLKWGIDKKDIKDCDVKVTNGVTTVMNGYIPVPVTEYTSTKNADGTYTVAAVKTSKNYIGSVTVKADGQAADEKPEAPYIKYVDVVGNKATVILSGDSEGAVGYDYVISTNRNCIVDKDYAKVNKNKLSTNTTFTYVQQDVYYAYCHAWKRDENGKKIFSDWSNPYPFVVSAITPETPAITGYKVNGNTVTVTYTKAANADGYDVVLGTTYGTVADEKRPLEYGELVKKNIKGNTVTATFKNVPKGTYYAGLHAYNRTSEDGKKVFSPWSNIKTIKVK